MKKKSTILIVVAVVIAAVAIMIVSGYNGLVNSEENVKESWAKVENQYQRRADLIPNLVNTVKGYAEHEQATLNAVVEARAKATQITIDVNNLDAATIQQYQEAQGELSAALGRLLAVSESYPDLKANENFRDLQAQLEGTENRIATERGRYSEAVAKYNKQIRQFPSNITAGLFGFEMMPQFTAEEGSQTAPDVQF